MAYSRNKRIVYLLALAGGWFGAPSYYFKDYFTAICKSILGIIAVVGIFFERRYSWAFYMILPAVFSWLVTLYTTRGRYIKYEDSFDSNNSNIEP